MTNADRPLRLCGTTQLYGIVGDPVRQVKAPEVVTEHLQQTGLDAVVVAFEVQPAQLEAFVEWHRSVRNLHGLIVTIPHKAAVLGHVDAASLRSKRSGVANVVRRERDGTLFADILDGEAFVDGLKRQGHEPRGRRAAIAGAGGAGTAVAWALAEAGVRSIAIRDVDPRRARTLASRLQREGFAAQAAPAFDDSFDLLVNASPVGMGGGSELPFPLELLRPGALAADLVMDPTDTAFLRAAHAAGCSVHHGHHLLDAELALFDRFFGFAQSTPRLRTGEKTATP